METKEWNKKVLHVTMEIDKSVYFFMNLFYENNYTMEQIEEQIEIVTSEAIEMFKKVKVNKVSRKAIKYEIYALLKEWEVDEEEVKKHEGLQNIIKNSD